MNVNANGEAFRGLIAVIGLLVLAAGAMLLK
jgi:hypothetical protein